MQLPRLLLGLTKVEHDKDEAAFDPYKTMVNINRDNHWREDQSWWRCPQAGKAQHLPFPAPRQDRGHSHAVTTASALLPTKATPLNTSNYCLGMRMIRNNFSVRGYPVNPPW